MAAYRADIEIGVVGAKQLDDLRKRIGETSKAVDALNRVLDLTGGTAQTLRTWSRTLQEASSNLKDVVAGTFKETQAIREYVTALGEANTAQARQNRLISEEIEARRKAGLARAGIRETTQYGGPIGPGPASPVGALVGQKSPVEERIKRTLAGQREQLQLEEALLRLEEKSAVAANKELEARAEIARLSAQGVNAAKLAATRQQFPVEGPVSTAEFASGQRRAARGRFASGLGKRLPGAVSGSVIGASFPLLFGQGGGAAIGGGVGGLLGGLAGPGGSFAGSLLGTLIGDIVSQGQKIKDLGTDIGFSAQQTTALADAFKKANTDVEKFTAVVQNIRGLGLELKDQAELIKLTTVLTEKYGGQFDKVGNAITSALESGRVSQATLNQLTSQGINVQQALADKLGVSRDRLLEMAKKGEISIQDLTNVLVELGNKGVKATVETKSGFDRLQGSFKAIGSELISLGGLIVSALKGPFDWLLGVIADVIQASANGISIIKDLLNVGSPNKVKAIAAVQQGRLPTGTAGVEELIGPKRMKQLQAQAGPGFLGLGFNESNFIKLLQKQPEFALPKTTPIKPIDVSGLGQAAPSGVGTGAGKEKGKTALQNSIKRTEALKVEAQTLLLAASIQDKINAAERIGAEQLALRLGFERDRAKVLGEYAAQEQKLANTANKNEEAQALRKKRNAELVALQLKYENESAVLETKRLSSGYEKQTQLQQEAFVLEQTLLGKGEEARLQVEIANAVKDLDATQTQAVANQMRKNFELQKQLDIAMQMKQLYADIGMTIKDGVVGAIQGAIDGTKTLQQVATDVLNSIANKLIDIAINMALFGAISGTGTGGGLLGKLIKPKAAGGPVMAGSPYLVGEKGPELFMPGKSGTIIPNNALGGGGSTSVVVNVDASGSNVQGNDAQAGQLGKVIGLAVQQELIKQKRPGGLLA